MKNLICISVIMLLLFMCFPKNGMAISVKSAFENKLTQKGELREQEVTASLLVTTRQILSGSVEKYKWADTGTHEYLVKLVNDKQKANKQIGQQKLVNDLTDKLEKKPEIIKVYQAQTTTRKETILFTQEEVKNLHHSDMEWQKPLIRTRSTAQGPVIKIQTPSVQELSVGSTIQTNSPVDLIISFSQNLHPVNMKSLEVIAKKGFFSKSLTDILKGYIRGNVLEAKGVKVPKGKFKIEVSIADQIGNRTAKTYRLLVRK